MNNQVVPELYSLKDDSPTNDYLRAIDDYHRCNEHLDDLNLKHLDDIDWRMSLKIIIPQKDILKIENLPLIPTNTLTIPRNKFRKL
ncbi:hypothetical protein KY289_030377 [Solanum tuberosum]|nr:hypothetical protein KY289_030377 [Solanum tuberosum]